MGNYLTENAWITILIIVGGIFLLASIATVILYINKKRVANKVEVKPDYIDNNMWVNALGGNENILSLEAKGSRLIVNVKDNALVKKDSLHDLGVMSVITSKDKVTLVLKEKAENIRNLLQ